MSISSKSNTFVFQLKRATVIFFKFSCEHPIITILLCSSGLLAVLFPKVFKSLVFFIPLLVSTLLFLAAIFSGGSQAPESITEASGERQSHADDEREEFDFELKQFNVIGRQGEPQITRIELAETIQEEIQEQKPTWNFEHTSEIKNGGTNSADFKVPKKQETTAANGDTEEAISFNGKSSECPLRVLIQEEVKFSAPLHQSKYSPGLVAVPVASADEEDNNDKYSEISAEEWENGADDQQKATQNSVKTTEINNAGRNLVEFKIPQEHKPPADQEEIISVYEKSSRSPFDLFVLKIQGKKELVPVEQPQISSGLGTEEEGEEGNNKQPEFSFEGRAEGEGDVFDIPLMNFCSMPLKSSWTRFDSSSDSISEASSSGSLGPLFDNLDPLLLTDEDDDPNASIQAHGDEEDRPMDWTEEYDGDENRFGLATEDGSDSASEEENLIEIELSEQQLLKRNEPELRQLQIRATEEFNLIDLDYSDDEARLKNLMDFFSEEGASSASALHEEENLIEIDLSADTLLVPANGKIIQSESAANKEKVSPIPFSARKEDSFADLSSKPLYRDYSYKTHPWKDGWIPKNTPPFVPKTTADLIDLDSSSIKEMNMLGLEDEKPNPEKTNVACDESMTFFGTKEIQHNKITDLLD